MGTSPASTVGWQVLSAAQHSPHLVLAVRLLEERHDLLACGVVQLQPGLKGAGVVYSIHIPAQQQASQAGSSL